jgi:ABC-type antimicrobial peptide transport system permease subunit
MTLGATAGAIIREILGRGLTLAAIGLLAGVVVALTLARFIAGLLYGVRPGDPATFVLVPLMLLVIAALACYIPARRATRVDPIVTLRGD